MYSIAVSESILKNHTPALNQVSIPGLDIATLSSRDYYGGNYRLSRINGKVLYSYPHGSSILSLPFVALMNAAGISAIRSDGSYDFRGELLIQKTLAAFLMAILAVVFFRTARLMLPISWSLVLARPFLYRRREAYLSSSRRSRSFSISSRTIGRICRIGVSRSWRWGSFRRRQR